MPLENALVLGGTLALVGATLLALTWLSLRAAQQPSPDRPPALALEETGPSSAASQDAVFLIQQGGRVIHANATARQWFGLPPSEMPNLENLGRRARPQEAFLDLCASQGQARFSVQSHLVEGQSYALPYEGQPVMLVLLRRPQLTSLSSDDPGLAGESLDIFSELSQEMSASLDLENTLLAVLANIDRLVPSDFSEITLWEPEREILTPYRYVGLAGEERQLEVTNERYQAQEGYSGHLIAHQSPLLINEVETYQPIRPAVDRQRFPLRSYLGVPLVIAGEPIGTLELASMAPGSFTPNDLEVLRILSGQAAVAIHNAVVYEESQRRLAELAGLANLAQAVGTLREPQDLFSHLVESIAPLLDVEILGFLIYEESQRLLAGQVPFLGMPEQFVELYCCAVEPNSPAEELLLSQEVLLAQDARLDPRIEALGLSALVQAAGVVNTVLVPLTSGGRVLGYLQAANKRGAGQLEDSDLRLLTIIAGQAGPIIENATLIQQSRRRARQAEAMRRIASLAGSGATLDEVLKFSLLELARFLQADAAAIFTLDQPQGELQLHSASTFGLPPDAGERMARLAIDRAQFHRTVTGSRKPFWTADVLTDERVLPLYRPLVDAMGEIHSVIAVPMEVRERGIGELLLGHRQQGFYNQNDVQLAATAARQIAGAIERADLTTRTDEDLRRQVDQLTSLHRVGREFSTTFELEKLLEVIHQEALHATQADCGTILLFDAQEDEARVPVVSLQLGDPLEDSAAGLVHGVLASGEATVVAVGDQAATSPHEGVRSTLVVPIAYQHQVLGQLHLHSSSGEHFEAPLLEVAQTLAAQAAIAIGNAHRFQDQLDRSQALDRRFRALSNLVGVAQIHRPGRSSEQITETIASAIQEALPAVDTGIFICAAGRSLAPAAGAGLPRFNLGGDLPWEHVQTLLLPAFQHSHSFLVPFEHWAGLWAPDPDHPAANELIEQLRAQPVALTPVLAGDGQPLALIAAMNGGQASGDLPLPIADLEIFGQQLAAALDYHHQVSQFQGRVEELQSEIERAQSATHLAGQQLPVMLHKDLEQTLTIHQLQERAHRMRAGLDIAEMLNHQPDRASVLEAVGLELLSRMHFDAALVAEQTPSGPRLLHYLSTTAEETNAEALLGQRNPLRQGLQTGEPILVPDLEEDQNWQYAPLLQALKAKGFICLPIATNGSVDAAVLATSQTPLGAFNHEDEQSFSLLAGQISMTLQNLSLLTETRRRLGEVGLLLDFSRQLGSLDPRELTRTLIDSCLRVIPSAEAGWVGIWSAKDRLLQPQAAIGYAENSRMLEIAYRSGEALPGQVFAAGEPRRVPEVDFAAQYQLSPDNLLRFREGTAGQLPLSSLLVPLQSGESALGLLVLDNFANQDAFTGEDQALVTSLAQQAALSLENARLYLSAEQRAAQLQALTRVAGTITSHLDAANLVATLLDQLASILPFDTGTLWLREGDRLSVRAARGFEEVDQRLGLAVAVEDSRLFAEMIAAGQPIHVPNIKADVRFPQVGEHLYLSWLGIPLQSKGEVIGVIALEKAEENFYTPEHVLAATTFAGQAAVALDNAALFAESNLRAIELDRRTQRLDLLNRISTRLSQSLELDRILEFTLQELHQAIPYARLSAVLFAGDDQAVLQAEMPQTSEGWQPEPLPHAPLFERLRETLGVFHTKEIETESELAPLRQFLGRHNTRALLALPLATGSDLHGLILMHSEKSERFASGEVELARTISNQAAVALQNARLFEQTRRLTEELEHRVIERTSQLQREHQRTQTLLSIITELSASLDMDIILNRTLALINEISDAGQSTILLVRPEEGDLFHRASLGYTSAPPTGGQPASLKPNEGLAGWVISNREAILIPDLLADSRWTDNPEQPSEHRSCIAIPLMVGEEALGTLMLFHKEAGHFSADLLDLIQATAQQIAVAINNAQLFRLIADQSERLGGMLRSQQIETSRSRAILESVADGVLVTDSNGAITLFNASAEEILNLNRDVVLGNAIEAFTGLFGGETQRWFDTIRDWSEDPSGLDQPDSFAAQINLEDRRVVAVSLAPVILRNEFLGTVSIFRDITHEVEVDRLKSEFVATVSHELRTPMTSIKGYVEVLLMGAAGDLSEQQREYLQVVDSNTRRLNVLVDDLLDISRIEARKVSLASQPVDLRAILEDSTTELQQRSLEEDRPMTIELVPASGLPRVIGDPERIQQIVFNLLDNAYNYTPERGRITVSAQETGPEVQVDIRDTGIGIPLAEQERVFERFYRGEDPLVLATAGTGLGLSIVRYLIEMHSGRVWIESQGVPGQGTCISFTLPRYTAETEA